MKPHLWKMDGLWYCVAEGDDFGRAGNTMLQAWVRWVAASAAYHTPEKFQQALERIKQLDKPPLTGEPK